jgi:hypothetical protein
MSYSVSGEFGKTYSQYDALKSPRIGPLDSYFSNVLIPGSTNRPYRKKSPAGKQHFWREIASHASSFSKNLIEVKRHEV